MTNMNVSAVYSVFSVFLSSILLSSLARAAEIGCVYPAGGAPGTTFDVSVRGQGLRMASGALISGGGVETAVLEVIPLNPAMPGSRLIVPHLQDEVRLRVTIDPNSAPGPRDFRLVCSNEFTTPLAFYVGRYAEVTESEPNNAATNGRSLPSLPVCVNGRITVQTADAFRFHASKGQTLVAQVQGRALFPYLVDTKPGWFQPLLTLFDSQGHEIAHADSFRFDSDPILVFTAPATSEYVLQLRDAFSRGRDDFVYRLTLGELPLVTGFFPMGGRKGDNLNVTLEGVNLPPQKVRIFSSNKTSDVCLQALTDGKLFFPPLRFDLDSLPECYETEAVGERDQAAQSVPFPVIVNGTIDKPGDIDAFRFEGKAGQRIAIETRARQLGSPLDTVIALADSRGKILVTHDDPTNVFTGLLTDPRDSALTMRLPADDTYEVRVSDKRGNGGHEYHYRLRISEPRPDFELWVTPSTLSIPLGGTVRANVHVRRIDGFSGPISLQLNNPPLGISCDAACISSNATEGVLTLRTSSSTKRLPQAPFELTLSGIATNGATILRQTAIPAHRGFQVSSFNHLVQDQTWMAEVDTEPHGIELPIILPPQSAHIRAAAKQPFTVTVSSGKAKAIAAYVSVQVVEPANGFIVSKVSNGDAPGDLAVTLVCATGKNTPPKNGNLILSVSRKSQKFKLANRPPIVMQTTSTPYAVE